MIKRIFLVTFSLLLLLSSSPIAAQNETPSSNPTCNPDRIALCLSESPLPCYPEQGEESLLYHVTPLEALKNPPLSFHAIDKQAEGDISILDSSVEIHFPDELVFNLEAESPADIINARLHYQVDKMNYAQVTSEGWTDFTPSTSIKIGWVWDMRRASLPPGTAITYWWTVEDAQGRKTETSRTIAHFDDLRHDWQSLTSKDFPQKSQPFREESGELTLFWYEGDDSFARELMDTCERGLARLTIDIGIHYERPIKIYVYTSARDLQEAMIFPQEWTGGAAFTEFGTIAIGHLTRPA